MAEEIKNEEKEMGLDEFKEFIETLKKDEGLEDEEILDVLYKAFEEGNLDIEDLKSAAEAMGYELNEDFEEELAGKIDEPNNDEEVPNDEDQVEAAKEIGEGESKEDFENRVEEGNKEVPDEEDEREQALKYFG